MMYMEYHQIFEECKKIFPLVKWGNLDKTDRKFGCLSFGFDNSLKI